MKNIILITITLLTLSACEQVLDKGRLDVISDTFVWDDPIIADLYLTQCYAELTLAFETQYLGANNANASDPNFGDMYTWFEITNMATFSDEASHGWVPKPMQNWVSYRQDPLPYWAYHTVRKINEFLEKIEVNDNMNQEYVNQRIAEAHFLRAFVYFNMVKRYGGVPLITKVQQLTDPEDELYPQRDKEEHIYDFIIDELDLAIAQLPEKQEGADLGRATKYAAMALKSRAAMYAASIATWGTVQLDGVVGIPNSRAQELWQASYNASDSIIKLGGFALYNVEADKTKNFRNIFLDENNSEVIYSEIFNGLGTKGHSWDMLCVPSPHHVWGAGQQVVPFLEMVEAFQKTDGTPFDLKSIAIDNGGTYPPTKEQLQATPSLSLDEIFANIDPRCDATVLRQGSSWKNGQINLDYHYDIEPSNGYLLPPSIDSWRGVVRRSLGATPNQSFTSFCVLKYLDEEERSEIMERDHSDTDFIIFRLGEILLNYAEAAIELGKTGDALWAVNELRKRAGIKPYTAIDRDKVRAERRVELAFEGNRYWDMRRWRSASAIGDKDQRHGLYFILDGNSYTEGNYDPATAKYKMVLKYAERDPDNITFNESMHYYNPITVWRINVNPNLVENPGYE